ncbi:MAG: PHP-associated domain-containing protein [Promethearchaeia archaeon]
MSIIDMHIHIKYRSRCSNLSREDLFSNLYEEFDGVCITDHWKLDPKNPIFYNGFKIFYGVELSSEYGDILAYGIKGVPSKNISAKRLIDYIHKQGGVAVCAHPYSNRHQGFGDYVFDFPFDAIELNGALSKQFHDLAAKAALEMDIPMIGGSDAHSIRQLNTYATEFDDDINSIEDIVNAIKNKNCRAIKIK